MCYFLFFVCLPMKQFNLSAFDVVVVANEWGHEGGGGRIG